MVSILTGVRRAALTAVALAAGVTLTAGAASASPTPPVADTALYGTWVNVDPATHSLTQIVVGRTRTGGLTVDAFGACSPTACEFGAVPAVVYGDNVSATTGATFQAHQTSGFAERVLTGTLTRTASGSPRLGVTMLSSFVDGSGRHNYVSTNSFTPGKGAPASAAGTPISAYAAGNPPTLPATALGTWTNTNPASGSLTRIVVGGTSAHPTVHAFGHCSPTDCDLGTVNAITYGKTVSAEKGTTALAAYEFGFKRTQLVITYLHRRSGDLLSVAEYNEFTDGSGRSNYSMTETFSLS